MEFNIINPNFKLCESNIFTLRKNDYSNMLPLIKQIVAPVTEIGFEIVEVDLKDPRFTSGELSKTIKQTVTIKLQKGTSNIDLSLHIPKLVDDNYIIINGRKKIPLFQLFDIPIVTRGENLKIRTNVATIMLSREKEEPFISISFMGRKVPLALLVFAYYGQETVVEKFDIDNFNPVVDADSLYGIFLSDLFLYNKESQGWTQDDFILELGRNYSKYNPKSKGEDILYALDLIPKIDPLSAKFLHNEKLLDEIVYSLQVGNLDDTLFTNKRVRCFEYMVYSKLSKIIFDLCFSNRTARQPKFNINSMQIINECNTSDIVQFDFSINPIEELTKLSRISLLGPGGFKRENIPKHLRDICPSMFGRVCPVDTPDRDNCGVLQNLIPNVSLNENMQFTEEVRNKQPVSIPVSMVPFLEHDDQTRLQMSSSQMRQAIMLKDFEMPMIKSGCEHLYTDQTQFIKRAKNDGEVVYIDNKYIIVIYSDGTPGIFHIGFRKIYVEHLDFMNVYVKVGDKFKRGDILAESNFCNQGNIQIGRNLLTGIMIYYGDNYEDGIIISDRLVKEDVLTSVHFKDLSFVVPPNRILLSLEDGIYKPLPDEFETVEAGNPYAITKSINSDDYYSVFNEPSELIAEKRYIISEINMFANDWNEEIPQYDEWIQSRLEAQKTKESSLKDTINNILKKEDANTFIRENFLEPTTFAGKYKIKKEKIDGILIEMTGIHFRKIKVGDKIANRHGNKGVISRIVPHDKMPRLPDGRHLDICINQLGIISRMNIGQVYELHLSMSLYDLRKNIKEMISNNLSQDEIKNYLLGFIDIVDKTDSKWYMNQFREKMPNVIDETFIDQLPILQPPFQSCKIEDIKMALSYTGTKFKYNLFEPISNVNIQNPIAVGYIYFLRMVHIAEEKIAARGIGTYSKRTMQPLGGRRNAGGQRCGEMETACIIGHDAPKNLFEFMTTKSDCIDLKNQHIRDLIDPNMSNDKKDTDIVPESVKLLNSYLTVVGVDKD